MYILRISCSNSCLVVFILFLVCILSYLDNSSAVYSNCHVQVYLDGVGDFVEFSCFLFVVNKLG